MYENEPNRDWLYPGDILVDLDLPNLRRDDFLLLSESDPPRKYSVRLMMNNEFFVYMSHDCDFNSNKRQFFILAPMLNIDYGLKRNPDDFQRFKDSNDITTSAHYLNTFYFAANPPALPEDKRIDFTRIISFPVNQRGKLLEKKVLQLDQQHRGLIKQKVGYYFLHEE